MEEKKKQAEEISTQDYINKIKEGINVKANVESKFITEDLKGEERIITIDDLVKGKKKTSFYWKNSRNGKYKVAHNVSSVKILIEHCENCTFTLLGPIQTNVVELWRCNNVVVNVDTEIFTFQLDLSNHVTLNYSNKKYLGSLVQAGVRGLRVNFEDYAELSFDSGFEILSQLEEHKDKDPPINDSTDQFITRFINGELLTELIIREPGGFHSTEREQNEFDQNKEANDKRTEEQLKKMLKFAGPAMGIDEAALVAKSMEGRAEREEKHKLDAQANLKKNAGNKAFSSGQYQVAVDRYTEAIELTPDNHLLFSNRCFAYIHLKNWEKSLEDANTCIELKPDFAKGHFRKGLILVELKRKKEAIVALTEAKDLQPKDPEILEMLEKANKL